MVVVGGVMWANFTPSYGRVRDSGRPDVVLQDETWGWPVAAYGRTILISSNGVSRPPAHWNGDPSFGFICIGDRNYDAIMFDVLAALAIAGVVGWGCETVIRRREGQM